MNEPQWIQAVEIYVNDRGRVAGQYSGTRPANQLLSDPDAIVQRVLSGQTTYVAFENFVQLQSAVQEAYDHAS